MRNCGATTGFNTQVSLLSAAAQLPNRGGNMLSLDDETPLQVEWENDAEIRVTGLSGARIFRREESVVGVRIIYLD